MKLKNILLVLTGGTICSFATQKGERDTDTAKAQTLIVENFRNGSSDYKSEEAVEFTPVFALNVLSENMSVEYWNELVEKMKSYDFERYDGVIILHGTDTLAYTASFLSLVLSGLSVPVIMVSSQLPLYESEANGNANFKAAVELIVNGIKPNVYAVYRNEETVNGEKTKAMYLHYGAHLIQCANHSNNFYSFDMAPISMKNAVFEGTCSKGDNMIFKNEKIDLLSTKVLKIQPYVGLDYSLLSLEGVDAIVHGTYHSSTVATETTNKNSILYLNERCKNNVPPIPLFIEPFEKAVYKTTGDALRDGILPIVNMTSEMAYVKTLVGCSLGLKGEELYGFLGKEINNEFLVP